MEPFQFIMPDDPHLPFAATEDADNLASSTTIITSNRKGSIRQIRDEVGQYLLDSRGRIQKMPVKKIIIERGEKKTIR